MFIVHFLAINELLHLFVSTAFFYTTKKLCNLKTTFKQPLGI